jgi:hypothetical protein
MLMSAPPAIKSKTKSFVFNPTYPLEEDPQIIDTKQTHSSLEARIRTAGKKFLLALKAFQKGMETLGQTTERVPLVMTNSQGAFKAIFRVKKDLLTLNNAYNRFNEITEKFCDEYETLKSS